VSGCAYPSTNVTCADCTLCDGYGTCSLYDYSCIYGTGGIGGMGGRTVPMGGTGGWVTSYGGIGGGYDGGYGGTRYDGGYGGAYDAKPNDARIGGTGGSLPRTGGIDGGVPRTGGIGGGIPVLGGAAGGVPNLGGAAGNIPNLGGAAGNIPGLGGSSGNRDGAVGDAGPTSLHKSGCSCELGRAGDPGWTAPLLFVGAAFLVLRRRRRLIP
jgi:MYXO-CTERM domain-containing protein